MHKRQLKLIFSVASGIFKRNEQIISDVKTEYLRESWQVYQQGIIA